MFKIFKFKLFWKFFIYYFLAQVISVILVGYLVWLHHQSEQENRVFENHPSAQLTRNSVASALHYGGEHAAIETINHATQMHAPLVYVVDQSKADLLGRSVPSSALNAILESGNKDVAVDEVTSLNGKKYYVFVLGSNTRPKPSLMSSFLIPLPPNMANHDIGFNSNATSTHLPSLSQSVPPEQRRSGLFPILPLAVGVIVSLFSALILAWNFSKPIKVLRKSFEEVAKGNLDVSVSKEMASRKDEIAELGEGFDQMVMQIKNLIQGQTRLLHHVSHEMRSPLARMQIALGLARQGSAKIETTMDRLELEVNRMDHLIGEVLDLSRLDSGIKKLTKEKMSLSELLDDIAEDASYEAKIKRVKVTKDWSNGNILSGNSDLLHRAIENIVRNAIKYSDEGEEVVIKCSEVAPDAICVTVTDQGPGVMDNELDDLFEPFYRGHSGNHAKGYGLGLAITKQIVEAHGGTVNARNRKPNGLCVEMRLPRN
jgi:two-component system, OmpR family, sensor kinase